MERFLNPLVFTCLRYPSREEPTERVWKEEVKFGRKLYESSVHQIQADQSNILMPV